MVRKPSLILAVLLVYCLTFSLVKNGRGEGKSLIANGRRGERIANDICVFHWALLPRPCLFRDIARELRALRTVTW